MHDLYKILGVEKSANEAEIKKAYRQLALQYHPDRNPGNKEYEAKFKEISSAYEILGDPEKRNKYDKFGDASNNPFTHDIKDIYERMRQQFRGAPNAWGSPFENSSSFKGDDISQTIRLSFMEAAKGVSKKISVEYPLHCESCSGTGADGGKALDKCKTCNGQGKVVSKKGFVQYISTCRSCVGIGHTVKIKCSECDGKGTKSKTENLNVTIPAGVENGVAMRLTGKGMPSEYGEFPGDLYLSIVVDAHQEFDRSGANIISKKEISYIDAILGTKVDINTIHGNVSMKISPGTQSNDLLKISGKGIITKQGDGDHLVKIKVSIPKKISNEEKELLNKLKKIKNKEKVKND